MFYMPEGLVWVFADSRRQEWDSWNFWVSWQGLSWFIHAHFPGFILFLSVSSWPPEIFPFPNTRGRASASFKAHSSFSPKLVIFSFPVCRDIPPLLLLTSGPLSAVLTPSLSSCLSYFCVQLTGPSPSAASLESLSAPHMPPPFPCRKCCVPGIRSLCGSLICLLLLLLPSTGWQSLSPGPVTSEFYHLPLCLAFSLGNHELVSQRMALHGIILKTLSQTLFFPSSCLVFIFRHQRFPLHAQFCYD